MRIFANKDIWSKIALVLLIITILSFIVPEPVGASIGGELMEPVLDLLVGIGDGIVSVIHKVLLGQNVTLLDIDYHNGLWQALRVIAAFAIGLLVAAAILATGVGIGIGIATLVGAGTKIAAVAAIGSTIGLALTGGGYVGIKAYSSDAFDTGIQLPVYYISPEEIFRGDLSIFDVNFFDPTTEVITMENAYTYDESTPIADVTTDIDTYLEENGYNVRLENIKSHEVASGTEMSTDSPNPDLGSSTGVYISWTSYKLDNGEYRYRYSEGQDISGTYTRLVIYAGTETEESTIPSYSLQLQSVVSSWYVTLRMIALVGMMSVLVYIGIKILLASSSSQKAKYKQLIMDWLVGMCLLFVMHYGMVFANTFVDKITELLASVNPRAYSPVIPLDDGGFLEEGLINAGYNITEDAKATDKNAVYKYEEDGTKYIEWNTDLMGQLRIDVSANRNKSEQYIGYTLLFLVMVIYLIVFVYTYIKRVIYMAFLTLIAPLVALTYPIDKANDGQAQGFNYWFKEYIFNLLLQPMHLLLYTILISGAIELATDNMLYAIVAIGFMVPAEKILRQMFNFSKASTPGVFGGATGAALTMSGIRWLMGHGPKGKQRMQQGNGGDSKQALDGSGVSTGNNVKPVKVFSNGTTNGSIESTPTPSGDSKLPKGNGLELDNGSPLPRGNEPAPNDGSPLPKGNETAGYDISTETSSNYPTEESDYTINMPDAYDLDTSDWEETQLPNEAQTEVDTGATIPASTGTLQPNFVAIPTEIQGAKGARPSSDSFIGPPTKMQKNIRGIKRGLKNAGDVYASGMKNKARNWVANSDPVGRIGKIGVGALGAATLGTLGVAAGIASGDASNVAKYGGAAAVGGAKLGSNAFKSASGALQVDGVGEEFERARLGATEYEKKVAKQRQEEMKRSEENIRYVQQKMKVDRLKAREILNEAVPVCMDSKMKNMEDILKVYKMTQTEKTKMEKYKVNEKVRERQQDGSYIEKMKEVEKYREVGTGQKYSYDEAISAYKFDKQYFSNFSQTTQKKREEMVQTWTKNEFKDTPNAEQYARNALRYVEKFNEINS